MTTTFESAKVGERVYSMLSGYTEVAEIRPTNIYPIMCGDGNTYTFDGKYKSEHNHQVLFWDKPTITAPTKPEPKREAPPVDTLVEILYGTTTWQKRYSAGRFDRQGYLECWRNGATSITAPIVYGVGANCTYSFAEWRIPQDNDLC